MFRESGPRRLLFACACAGVALLGTSAPPDARAGDYRLPTREPSTPRASSAGSGWWLGPAGIALALALFGGASVACRRFLPRVGDASRELKVVGRASLSPKHAVLLVRAGDRTLIIGTGPQGPPALLGEWSEPRPARSLDARIGEDDV